jgi:hypothetical protein
LSGTNFFSFLFFKNKNILCGSSNRIPFYRLFLFNNALLFGQYLHLILHISYFIFQLSFFLSFNFHCISLLILFLHSIARPTSRTKYHPDIWVPLSGSVSTVEDAFEIQKKCLFIFINTDANVRLALIFMDVNTTKSWLSVVRLAIRVCVFLFIKSKSYLSFL